MNADSEFDVAAAEQQLYGTDKPEPVPKADDQGSPAPDAELAAALHPERPDNALPIGVRQILATIEDTQARVLGRTSAERLAYGQEIATLARDTGLPSHILQDIVAADVAADQADLRLVPEEDPAVVQLNMEELRAELLDTFGPERAEKYLTLTSQFVSAHPVLQAILSRRGNASRKNLVLPILEEVRRRHLEQVQV